MLFEERKFFEEDLDLTIPELKAAAELYAKGERDAAVKQTVAYIKSVIDPEKYLTIPYDLTVSGKYEGKSINSIDIADLSLEGKFSSVGVWIDFGKDKPIDWFANPCYNKYREWGLQFHRHPYWSALAVAYRQTGDEKYAEGFAKQIRSWLLDAEDCPLDTSPYNTLHWRTIECGIRMTKPWHNAIHAFKNSPAIDDELWLLIFRSISEHAYRLRNFRTKTNWLMMEMAGLTHIAVFYPFFKDSAEWLSHCIDTLTAEVDIQFYKDNFQVELSTGYHWVSVSNYKAIMAMFSAYGVKIPDHIIENYRRMYLMYVQLCTPGFYAPALNDSGASRLRPMMEAALEYFPDDELFKYFYTSGAEGTPPDYKTFVMPYAGMIAMRTGWTSEDMWAFLDAGPFGQGHQHEDKLNFLLYAYGVDMLPDEGVFRYDKSAMRQYVLGTRAHNTGLVDGLEQNRRGKYWTIPFDVNKKSDMKVGLYEDYEVAQGTYNEGYGPDYLPATHTRKVIFFKKGLPGTRPFFVLLDAYACDDSEHTFETSFQLTAAPISMKGKKVTASYNNGATLNFISSVYPDAYIGKTYPEYMGWRPDHTPEVREHIPAPILSYKVHDVSANIITVLYPSPDEECPIKKAFADAEGFEITVGDETHRFEYTDKRFEVFSV